MSLTSFFALVSEMATEDTSNIPVGTNSSTSYQNINLNEYNATVFYKRGFDNELHTLITVLDNNKEAIQNLFPDKKIFLVMDFDQMIIAEDYVIVPYSSEALQNQAYLNNSILGSIKSY
jgi:hypothetical protein